MKTMTTNFGQQKSNFNDITGATIITSTKNQDIFEENYQKMLDGRALAEAAAKQQVTLFPITIKIPSALHKELEVLAAEDGKKVEEIATQLFLENLYFKVV